jgi:hypothetical protein
LGRPFDCINDFPKGQFWTCFSTLSRKEGVEKSQWVEPTG